ncbi:MAG: hypothetical protein KatS3mg119_0657 [Rhodothalassiaceae bacterium]|nr:MAG: hypothetical protein KatS3mg119_0657 [Rhodothalassiaceae bacterium]
MTMRFFPKAIGFLAATALTAAGLYGRDAAAQETPRLPDEGLFGPRARAEATPAAAQSADARAQSGAARPRLERDELPRNWYAGLSFLGNFVPDQPSTMNDTSIFPSAGRADFDAGTGISGTLGRRIAKDFRVEFEFAYNNNEFDRFALEDADIFVFPSFFFGPILVIDPPNLQSFDVAVNGYWDLPNIGPVRPYVGGGGGIAVMDVADAALRDDTDVVWLAELRGGISYPLPSHLELFLGYRYQITGDPHFRDAAGNRFHSRYRGHAVEGGLRFWF